MTTATIGKGQTGLRARVALVAKGTTRDLAALLTRAGHEVFTFDDWASFGAAEPAPEVDLLLVEDAQASTAPRELSAPAILVGDRSQISGGRSLGGLSLATIEAAAEPLLDLALELRQSVARCREFERLVVGVRDGSALVGRSPVVRRLQSALSRAADNDTTVLLEGPRGSGKSLAARIIHCKSRRSGNRLEIYDCGDLDGEALTTAIGAARGGTLLLEGIDRLPSAAQSVLVRHLKERSGPQSNGAARIIVTTSAHLPELVAKGAFREDLYYRLHAFPIVVPALRERTEDIVAIAVSILDAAVTSGGRPHQGLTPAASALIESMTWSGNVTQLEAVLRRANAMAGGAPIDREHLLVPAVAQPQVATPTMSTAAPADTELDEDAIRPFEEEEQFLLSRALRATKGNVRRAAQLLRIGRATLYRKIQQYKLRLQ